MNTEIRKELRRDSNINAFLLMLFWLLYYALSFIIPLTVSKFKSSFSESELSSLATLMFYIILYPVGFPLIFLVFRKISRKYKDQSIKTCFQKPQMPAGWVVKWIFLTIGSTYAAAIASSILFMLIENITGFRLNEMDFSTEDNTIGTISTLLTAPVFAPIFEELFFRGTIYRNVQKYSKWSMIIIGGLTFGLWHANYPQFLFAASMGIFSCFLFEKTKSIIPSMIVHFTINSISSCSLILISKSGFTIDELTSLTDISILMKHPFLMLYIILEGLFIVFSLVTWFILMIIEIAYHPESFRIEDREPETSISGGKAFITYMTAPLMAVMMLGMLALTVYRALGGDLL